jgi:hypothetical protein
VWTLLLFGIAHYALSPRRVPATRAVAG